MKIELMNLIANELDDVDVIKNMISAYDNLSEEDIKKILTALKECEYNDNALIIAIDLDVIENRSLEEQIQLMEELKEYGYKYDVLEIATDKDVLEQRTPEEQIQLMYTMHTLEKCKYRYGALEIAIDKNILESRTIEEQIKLMNSYVKKGELTHSDNLNKINDLKELKKYVCNLQKVYDNDTDIKIKDVVKLYKQDI